MLDHLINLSHPKRLLEAVAMLLVPVQSLLTIQVVFSNNRGAVFSIHFGGSFAPAPLLFCAATIKLLTSTATTVTVAVLVVGTSTMYHALYCTYLVSST